MIFNEPFHVDMFQFQYIKNEIFSINRLIVDLMIYHTYFLTAPITDIFCNRITLSLINI